ncbi:MAG: IS66 family insertion sequence element accessory protein TnpB [Alcaligenaceae bacterium]|nr:IS66 family insertion sequence element accessory protein TnpB [Alcaligenaceae bacterium]
MHPGASIGQVYLCCLPVDFRKQIDGLAALVEGELEQNLFGDALFVFTNRQRSRIKILYWHRNGFCLWQKRLEKERFAWPVASAGAGFGEEGRGVTHGYPLVLWMSGR